MAQLLIKRKEGDVDFAGNAENGGRLPYHTAVITNDNVYGECGVELGVHTTTDYSFEHALETHSPIVQEHVRSPHGVSEKA